MEKRKKLIIVIAILAAIALLSALFAMKLASNRSGSATGDEEFDADIGEYVSDETVLEDDPTTKDYDNGIYFDEEDEDAEIETVAKNSSDFVGKWTATSGQAAYFYGNIDLEINSDNTWTGNITEEPLKGKWEERDGGLYLTSEIFNCTLKFSSEGNLLMQQDYEEDDEDGVVVVLTKK